MPPMCQIAIVNLKNILFFALFTSKSYWNMRLWTSMELFVS